MNGSDVLLSTSIPTLGWTLVHSLWQGALVAAGLAGLLALLRRGTANVRYAISCTALLVLVALPVATFMELRTGSASSTGPATSAAPVLSRDHAPQVSLGSLVLQGRRASTWIEPLLSWAVLVWFGGVSLLSVRFLGGWMRVQSLRRRHCRPAPAGARSILARLTRKMGETRPVILLESGLVEVPTVLGFLRPVILVPVSLFTGFSAPQIEMLLLHELAHIRRHDYLVNLFQSLVEILLFYHPAAWWISRRIRIEREDCCDDAAVAICGDALGYARALADLEELRGLPSQWAVAATGGSLLHRVRRLVETRKAGPSGAGAAVLAALLIAAVVTGAGMEVSSAGQDVQSQSPAAPAASPGPLPAAQHVSAPAAGGKTVTQPRAAQPAAQLRRARAPRPAELPARPATRAGDELAVALARYGAAEPTPEQLVELRRFGVTPWVLERMQDLGYSGLSIDEILAARRSGVTPWMLAELRESGYGELSMEQILELRRYGVTPDTLNALEELGYEHLEPQQLVQMGALGVTPSFLEAVQAAGLGGLPLEQILELRRRGVTADSLEEAVEVLRDGGAPDSPEN